MQSRSVESLHYHVWTDALRGRDLAQTARDEWDRGTFVRWSISSAWTAFEHAVNDALGLTSTGSHFWPHFDDGCRKLGIDPPQRGHGLWQQVAEIHILRKNYTHLKVVDQPTLLLKDAAHAEKAIKHLREAIQDLHARLKNQPPEWIEDDVLPKHPSGSRGTLTIGHGGVDPDDPDAIQVRYQYARQSYSALQASYRDFDRAIFTISGGALILSVTFADEIAADPRCVGVIRAAWIAFTVAMLMTLTSYITSQKELAEQIRRIPDNTEGGGLTTFFNYAAAGGVVIGAVLLVIVAWINYGRQ